MPACRKSFFSLHFDGRALRAVGSKKTIYYPADSGRPIKDIFDYSRERQEVREQGPIPEGAYWIQPTELQENAWYRLQNSRAAWGDFWITIHPFPSTETHQRGGFFIHGGSTRGSAGCIDLTVRMKHFANALAEELKGRQGCYIPLTVRYDR